VARQNTPRNYLKRRCRSPIFDANLTVTNSNVLTSLRDTLQQARKAKRLSQLELSMRIGVSQRHLSFIESGRARPSRSLLLAWLQELGVSLMIRNRAMLQAGYAPVYADASDEVSAEALEPAQSALKQLLSAHDPFPAYVIDAHWNLVDFNHGGRWLARAMMPWTADLPDDAPFNMLDLLVMPNGITHSLLNLAEVGPAMLSHIRDDADALPDLRPKVDAFADLLRSRLGENIFDGAWPQRVSPVLTSRFKTEWGDLAFFSMFTTFGTPQDIRLESLRVEHMFPADQQTRDLLMDNASSD
jgi:transcriptional regulator with XRE-family HTH domain